MVLDAGLLGCDVEEARKELKTGLQSIADALCCPVCLELIDQGKSGMMCLPCTHVFCGDCIKKFENIKANKSCPICKQHFDRRMVQEDLYLASILQLFRNTLPTLDFEVKKDDSRRVSDLHNPTPEKPSTLKFTVEASKKQPSKSRPSDPPQSTAARGSREDDGPTRPQKRGLAHQASSSRRPGPSDDAFESESMALSIADEAFNETLTEAREAPSARQQDGKTRGGGGRAPPAVSSPCRRGVKRPLPSSGSSTAPPVPMPVVPPVHTESRQSEERVGQATAPQAEAVPQAQAQAQAAPAPLMPTRAPVRFKIKDVVEVLPRMGVRSNKPGGPARVVRVREDGSCDVRYVLYNRLEAKVCPAFLRPVTTTERSDRAARRRTSMPSLPVVPFQDPIPPQRTARRLSAPAPLRPSAVPSSAPSTSSTHPDHHDPTPPAARVRHPLQPSRVQHQARSERQDNAPAESDGDSFMHRPHEMVLVATSLSERVMEQVRAFAKRFGARVEKAMGPKVTHVICKADKQRRAEQRTLKYLHGLLNRRWVVSSKWITDSLKDGQLKPELEYELQGDVKANRGGAPNKARLSRVQDKPSLFQDITFSFYGEFPPPKPTRKDLEKLIEAGRGRVINNGAIGAPPEQSRAVHQQQITYILCNSLPSQHVDRERNENQPPIVNSDWILDSISNYKLQSSTRYYPAASPSN